MGALRVVSVQLGPITFDAGLLSAVKEEDGGLVTLCTHEGRESAVPDPSRIRRRDYCPDCDNDDKATFAKGKKLTVGGYQIVDVSAVEELAPTVAQKKTVPLTVHPAAELTGLFFSGKAYYLEARGATASTYALLATLMRQRPDLGFIGEFSFGGAPALYQVLEDRGVLVMRQVARPETVQAPPVVNAEPNERWLALASAAADAVCTPYDPKEYRDRRAELLGRILEQAPPAAEAGDLGAMLEAYLAKRAATQPRSTTAKKAPAKKTAAKKTAAKRTTAKKKAA